MPSTAEVATANQAIVQLLVEGDAIRPVPFWFADARLEFHEWPILAGNALDSWEVHRYRRIFVVYPTTHELVARAEVVRLGLTNVAFAYESEGYSALVGDLPSTSAVLWDAAAAIEDATASQVGNGDVSCDNWTHDAWHCGRFNAYIFAGSRIREMGDQEPRRCIALNAPEPPASWQISWDGVPAASRTLRVRAGNTYEAVRAERGGPVSFRVRINGEIVHEEVFGIHDTKHEGVEFKMPASEAAEVQFEVGSADHFDRFFCVQAQVVE
jgi:hypothetical protein